MTDGLYVPLRAPGFRRSADRSAPLRSCGDSQSFRGCRVDRASSREPWRAASYRAVSLPLKPPLLLSQGLPDPSFGHPNQISTARTMAGTTIATIVLLAVIQAAMCNNCSRICYPSEFFPDVKGNLTKIVWAHAVNSQAELEKALSSEDVMMLEADVVMGKLTSNTSSSNYTDIPIMAHPPATESDLSLEDFLNITNTNGTKGIKLDFKTDEAFENSKPILKKLRSTLKYPVFLNADILSGPVKATTVPLNAKKFLEGANDTIPESILSVGWTTRYGKEFNITEGRYTKEHFKRMVDTLAENNVTQPVTYPVRAVFAANDIDAIETLLKSTTFTNATLTIWSSEGDSVDAAQLSKLITKVGINKVYVDVPKDLRSKLNLSAGSAMTPAMIMNLGASLALLALSKML